MKKAVVFILIGLILVLGLGVYLFLSGDVKLVDNSDLKDKGVENNNFGTNNLNGADNQDSLIDSVGNSSAGSASSAGGSGGSSGTSGGSSSSDLENNNSDLEEGVNIEESECGFYFESYGVCGGRCPSGTCVSEGNSCYCKNL